MSNFSEAYNHLLALIADGHDFESAQDATTIMFGLDEVEAEGLAEEYFTAEDDSDDEFDDDMSAVEADADVLRMVGWGTDEDYGDFGGDLYE